MMHPSTSLVLSSVQHRQLRVHLFPGDGLEAAALLLCRRIGEARRSYLVCDVLLVPHAACSRREPDALSWPGSFAEHAIDRAEQGAFSIVALHSHPGGLYGFSSQDDAADAVLLPALYHATGKPSLSAIMVPSGAMRARMYQGCAPYEALDHIICAGDDISIWRGRNAPGEATLPPVAFTQDMRDVLTQLCACVIGVSGTGSIVAEQLARIGFGSIILIDFDRVEARNLDRILNSTQADADAHRLKVDMFKDAIGRYGSRTLVRTVAKSIATREAVLASSEADVMFSCVDTGEGRHIADRLAAACVMPLFDVGVSIPTRNAGGQRVIAEVCGRIDYVQPGGATLIDRDVYSAASLEAEYLARTAPDAHKRRIAEGYMKGIAEQAPSVIALNMRAASATVMEFIARAFPFRHTGNENFARSIFMLAGGEEEHFAEASFPRASRLPVATGLEEPLLGLPALALPRKAA